METKIIDHWLYDKENIKGEHINQYFCFELKYKYNYLSNAFWSDKKPDGFCLLKTVKWKIGHLTKNIFICYKRNLFIKKEKKLFEHYKEIDIDIKNIPILKSNLQKCIRRNLVNKSLKTAYNLMEIDFTQFIRRLAIIMLEDCVLDSSITTIIWMTSALPEWEPNLIDKSWLLGVVYLLSKCKKRELVKQNIKFNILNFEKKINNMKIIPKSIIYSLQFRKSYGGMKGDMEMISYFSYLWYERFIGNYQINLNYLNNIRMIKLDIPMSINDIEISCIDFHIFPIDKLIHKKFPLYSEKIIKDAIWYNSSSISNKNINSEKIQKKTLNKKYVKVWLKIKQDFYKLAYYFLKININ